MLVFEESILRVIYPWRVYHSCICNIAHNIAYNDICMRILIKEWAKARSIETNSYFAQMFQVTFSASARMYPGEVIVTWNLGRTYFFTSNTVVCVNCGWDFLFSTLIFQAPCKRYRMYMFRYLSLSIPELSFFNYLFNLHSLIFKIHG